MKREIGTERLYSLGDFKNIKFMDIIIEVPQELVMNDNLINEVKFLQLVSIELAFRRYMRLMEEVPLAWGQKSIEALEKIRQDTIKTITSLLKNGDTEA
jgi:hypothetical protein